MIVIVLSAAIDVDDDFGRFQSPKRLHAFFHLHCVHQSSFFSMPYCFRHFLFSPRGRRFGDNGERWITDVAPDVVGALWDRFNTSECGWNRQNYNVTIDRTNTKTRVFLTLPFLPVANDEHCVTIVSDALNCCCSELWCCSMHGYCLMSVKRWNRPSFVAPMPHWRYAVQPQLHLCTSVMDMAQMKLMGVVIIVHVFVVKSENYENDATHWIHWSNNVVLAFLFLQYIPNFAVPMCNCDELMVNLEYWLLPLHSVMVV